LRDASQHVPITIPTAFLSVLLGATKPTIPGMGAKHIMKFSLCHIVAISLLLSLAARAQQYAPELDVGVRTQLDRNKKLPNGNKAHTLQDAPEHGKIYAILMVQPTNSVRKLIEPVNAAAIQSELVRQLEAHGYHHVQPNQKPEIILTVIYGRSWLPNPYFVSTTDVDNMGPELQQDPSSDAILSVEISDPAIAARLMQTGIESKATKASYEKLFILVRAFKYPPPVDPKQKPEVLWVTTMYVDDPDHRDLNTTYKLMLEAGAPYFDKEINTEEVDVIKPLPEGHVKVGTPEVVEPKSK